MRRTCGEAISLLQQGGYCGGYELQGWLAANLEGSRVAFTISAFLPFDDMSCIFTVIFSKRFII